VGFVVDKVALGQVFSEYFGFPCQSSFHQLLHNHHHLSSGAGTIGQQWAMYQVDSVSPHPEKLKKQRTTYYEGFKESTLYRVFLTRYSTVVTTCTICSNMKNMRIFPQNTYVFHTILRINSDDFPSNLVAGWLPFFLRVRQVSYTTLG
jgi:hypothetical protein